MEPRCIDQRRFDSWLEALIELETVYAPQAKAKHFVYGRLRRAADLRLDYDVTILPPKKYFQPPKETLMRFDRRGQFSSVLPEGGFILFGVHPYDMEAISQMDEVFAKGHSDVHYQEYRRGATIVVSDVLTPSAHVFAGCMGHATADNVSGFDVLLTKIEGGRYVVEARTYKGNDLVELLGDAPLADEQALAAREQLWAKNRAGLRQHELKTKPEQLPPLLEASYEHPIWEEKAALCYACGSCTLVCPTCYCFDVEDELDWNLETGSRFRRWDGCLFKQFAAVAGDHNFRRPTAARYRHRYYRKAKYMWDVMGRIACVGCGRCIGACTAKIANPVEVFNRLQETVNAEV